MNKDEGKFVLICCKKFTVSVFIVSVGAAFYKFIEQRYDKSNIHF